MPGVSSMGLSRKSDAFLSRARTHDKSQYRKAVINLAKGATVGINIPGFLSVGELALAVPASYQNIVPWGAQMAEVCREDPALVYAVP